ncbi:MAG TPA: D-glycerate dehydrogenase [Candidatus Binataceae bacterium]|nr:D-glycerate dehydrogenase [Candidatus Binataceae bacterium]
MNSSKAPPSHHVFVTRPIAEAPLRRLAEYARVDLWDDDLPPPPEELSARLTHCDGVLSMVSDRFDEATISAAPRLAVISNLAVGVDNIDLEAATRIGVAVGHTPGVLSETTADLAFALMLAVARRVAESDRFVRAGRWKVWTPRLMLGRDVWGATLGIVGFGAIGRAVGRRAAGFGMRVLYTARGKNPAASSSPDAAESQPQPVELMSLLRESDIVSLHVPLTPANRQLIGAKELAAMKRSAILINTARGAIVDQVALAAALNAGRIGGAGLDVAETEPISLDDPLLKMANVVITPHIGSASHATRLRMAELAVDNLLDVFAGRLPRHCANPALKAVGRSVR